MSADWIAHLFHDAGRVELRHEVGGRFKCGMFDDERVLRATAAALGGQGNLYTSLNAPHPRVCSNRMGGDASLRDDDIGFVVRIPFDFDPVRPAGMPSTDAELRAAVAARDRMVLALHAKGWPAPALGVSGNGAHAVYRCRMPATPDAALALKSTYYGLEVDFGTPEVAFDRSVRNPGRILRLYGSTNRKGEATGERPHRVSRVEIPQRWETVSLPLIERVATVYIRRTLPAPADGASARARPPGIGDYSTLDVGAWFQAHDMYRRPLGDGKHAVVCPWNREHSTRDPAHSTSTVAWDARCGRWATFHCSHAHCAGRTIRDVMARWGDADHYCGRMWTAR